MIRYLSYFNTLADLDERDPRWAPVTAGLLVLRAFDDWIEAGVLSGAQRSMALLAVRGEVERLPIASPQRALLDGILRAIESGVAHPGSVLPRFFAYARALHYEGDWTLAGDVFERVAELAASPATRDIELAMDARMQRAYCLRMQGRLDDADVAYHEAGRMAIAMDDAERALRARVGQAKIVVTRGNYPLATVLLDTVIAEAQRGGHRMAAGMALHDRGNLAIRMGEFAAAARLLFTALDSSDDAGARDRVLADLAGVLLDMGAHDAARDALVVVTLTSQQKVPRWQSELNLIELAITERNELAFEQHRRALADVTLPPEFATYYHLFTARGLATFGRNEAAVDRNLDTARAIAAQHGFHQLTHIIEMDAAAHSRVARTTPPVPAARPLPVGLRDIAAGIRELREVVETGR